MELMENSHDFGWSAAKGAHAVLLCKMEEGRVHWDDTHKIDRIRRAHAQKVQTLVLKNERSQKTIPLQVGISKNRLVRIRRIMRQMVVHIYTYAAIALQMERNIDTPQRTVGKIQKRVGHCFAAPNHTNDYKTFKTRIFVNSMKSNVQSVNWSQDWEFPMLAWLVQI